jgi:hypothetical protein
VSAEEVAVDVEDLVFGGWVASADDDLDSAVFGVSGRESVDVGLLMGVVDIPSEVDLGGADRHRA